VNWSGTIGDIFVAYWDVIVLCATHFPWGWLPLPFLLAPAWLPLYIVFVLKRNGGGGGDGGSDFRYSPTHYK
jgi:hypothetical protein